MENPKLIARTMALQDASRLEELWLQYWANGGDADRFDFDAYVHDLSERDPFLENNIPIIIMRHRGYLAPPHLNSGQAFLFSQPLTVLPDEDVISTLTSF